MNEPEPTNLTGTVVRGVSLAGAGYVVAQLLTLVVFLVLARLVTPEEFGQFAAASILVGVGLLFTESGMMAALIHRRDRIDEAASTATVATFAAGLGFALVALAASPLIGLFFDSGTIAEVAAAVSGLILLRSIPVVPEALLQRRFSFVRRVVIEPIGVAVFGATAIVATSNDMGVWGLVVGYYAGAAADVILSWALVGWRPRLRSATISMWRELVGYGRHVLAGTALLRVGEQVPVILLGRFVGAGPLGQFRYADRIAATPFALVLAGASYVLFPAFARISHDAGRFRDAFLRSLRWIAAISFPLGMILLPLGVPIAVTVFGEVWRDAGYAAMALSAFTGFASLISITTEAFKAAGRPEILTRVHGLTVAVGASASAALLPFELVGVAGGVTVGAAVGAIYALHRATAVLAIPVRLLIGAVFPAAVAALLMAASLLPIEHLVLEANKRDAASALALLAAEIAFAAAVYVALLRLMAPELLRELRDRATGPRAEASPARSATAARSGEPQFSVVIPAYNGARTVEASIRSVLAQTRGDFELVVVDDGSTDETVERVARFESDPRVRLVRQRNAGTAAARNTGIRESSAPYVAFLDNDDLWLPRYLAEMGTALDAEPEAGFAYTDGWWLDDSTRRILRDTVMSGARPPDPPPGDPDSFLEALIEDNFVLSSVTTRRTALDAVGGFNAEIRGVDDYDLWLRIVAAGYRAVRAPGLLVVQRDRFDSQSKNELLMLANLREVCRRAADQYGFPAKARATARRRLTAIDRDIATERGEHRLRAAAKGARSRLVPIKRRVLSGRVYHREPPAEVADAFGDLSEL